MTEKTCFHCGLPVDPKKEYPVLYKGEDRPTCCPGCQAVAQSIIASGLGSYYETRTAPANKADLPPQEILDQIKLYDLNEVQERFVLDEGDAKEAVLMLDGVTCAACVWLIEQRVNAVPGVVSAEMNYTTERARVRWDPKRSKLSDIILAIKNTGYDASPYDPSRYEEKQRKERRQSIIRLWVAGLSAMQVMMYAAPTYLYGIKIDAEYLWTLHWAAMVLTFPVVFYSAVPFYRGFIRDVKNRRVGMDTPIALAVGLAFCGSSYAMLKKAPEGVFFDSISMFVFLLLAGRYLEQTARLKANSAAEKITKLAPSFCHAVTGWPDNRAPTEALAATLKPGDAILVKPGETIPVDGFVLDGESEVNEAMLTGESLPVSKKPLSRVIAGTINVSEALYVQTEAVGAQTRLGGISRLFDEALSQKPKIALLADRYASIFVGCVLIAALIVFAVWASLVGMNKAMWVSISMLVITCPCALSLATPTALIAATGNLADKGMLIARGHALETLPKINVVAFDKTGTLTEGELSVVGMSAKGETQTFAAREGGNYFAKDRGDFDEQGQIAAFGSDTESAAAGASAPTEAPADPDAGLEANGGEAAGDKAADVGAKRAGAMDKSKTREYLLAARRHRSVEEQTQKFLELDPDRRIVAIAKALEETSDHPVAKAFAAFMPELEGSLPPAQNARNRIGRGMEAQILGKACRIGKLDYVAEIAGPLPKDWAIPNGPRAGVVALGDEDGYLKLFLLEDALKSEAKDAVRLLKERGLKVAIVSGDQQAAVDDVADELGVEERIWSATPEEKLQCIDQWQKQGLRVMMVGDGMNDAPVLAKADVSIAMDSGADAAQSGSDMILISHDLKLIARSFEVAARARRVINENFAWAALYNLAALPIAATGHATPALAALGMSGSSFLIALNALRLLR